MTMSPRALIILGMSVLPLGPIDPAFSDTHDKESSTEAPAPRPQRPPTASEGQPAPTKPPTDVKAQSSPAPATKADSQPAESESKEKDQTAKRTLGSLILSVKLALMGDPRLFRYEIE